MKLLGVLLFVALLSTILTSLVRNYAIKKRLVDTPNHRSSHTITTPKGGGVGFVFIFLLTLACAFFYGVIGLRLFSVLFVSGFVIALTGWIDDHRDVSSLFRLIIHISISIGAVIGLGSIQIEFPLGLSFTTLALPGFILSVLGLVWLINLYNFMDGINGIASIETISVCMGAAYLAWVSGSSSETWLLPAFLAASVAGLLVWNFPVAKLFMGDVGSGFLGIIVGILALYSALINPDLLWAWIILLGVFIVDATLTLTRRVFAGKNFAQAHNSHAYQNAARRYHSHVKVSLAVLLINVCWLLPIAYITSMGLVRGLYATLIAFVPLIMLGFIYKAGLDE